MFDPLVESLEQLVKKHPLERIRSGADELRLAIQTRGFMFNKRSPTESIEKVNKFQAALDQLSDPLLPVQGHAILTLSHLLKSKDEQALKNRERLLKVFLDSLDHEDSYIYMVDKKMRKCNISSFLNIFVNFFPDGNSGGGRFG